MSTACFDRFLNLINSYRTLKIPQWSASVVPSNNLTSGEHMTGTSCRASAVYCFSWIPIMPGLSMAISPIWLSSLVRELPQQIADETKSWRETESVGAGRPQISEPISNTLFILELKPVGKQLGMFILAIFQASFNPDSNNGLNVFHNTCNFNRFIPSTVLHSGFYI